MEGNVLPNRERVLGVAVDAVSREMAARAIVQRALETTAGAYVCLTNAYATVDSQRSNELRRSIEGAFLSVPDGVPLVWILHRRGHPDAEKVTGVELMPMVAAAGVEHGIRHFLYGGDDRVAEAATRRLEQLVPGVEVVGSVSPSFTPLHDWIIEDVMAEVERTKPHILWVGLGAPKQEKWMARAAGLLDVPIMVGVGAAFDFLGGTKKAAPSLVRHSGFEWLFRLASEPRRLWRRYLLGNPEFVYRLAREAVLRKRRG